MLRMTINISSEERDALVKLARREHRDFRQQAAFLVRRQLEQLGLIEPVVMAPQDIPTQTTEEAHHESA